MRWLRSKGRVCYYLLAITVSGLIGYAIHEMPPSPRAVFKHGNHGRNYFSRDGSRYTFIDPGEGDKTRESAGYVQVFDTRTNQLIADLFPGYRHSEIADTRDDWRDDRYLMFSRDQYRLREVDGESLTSRDLGEEGKFVHIFWVSKDRRRVLVAGYLWSEWRGCILDTTTKKISAEGAIVKSRTGHLLYRVENNNLKILDVALDQWQSIPLPPHLEKARLRERSKDCQAVLLKSEKGEIYYVLSANGELLSQFEDEDKDEGLPEPLLLPGNTPRVLRIQKGEPGVSHSADGVVVTLFSRHADLGVRHSLHELPNSTVMLLLLPFAANLVPATLQDVSTGKVLWEAPKSCETQFIDGEKPRLISFSYESPFFGPADFQGIQVVDPMDGAVFHELKIPLGGVVACPPFRNEEGRILVALHRKLEWNAWLRHIRHWIFQGPADVDEVTVHDLEAGRVLARYVEPRRVARPYFTSDGRTLCLWRDNHVCALYDFPERKRWWLIAPLLPGLLMFAVLLDRSLTWFYRPPMKQSCGTPTAAEKT